jgi:CheY-like chemotaxis protein
LLVVTAKSFIEVLPSLLWFLLAAAALALFYRPLTRDVLPHLKSIKLPGGIELALGERVQAAAQKQKVSVSADDQSRIVRRLERSAPLLNGARILWVDDHPEFNVNEAATLEAFGALITFATDNEKALSLLDRESFHLVITDWKRDEEGEDAGKELVEKTGGRPWTIFYVGHERRKPEQAFALTRRPNQLLHYVLDALERSRG